MQTAFALQALRVSFLGVLSILLLLPVRPALAEEEALDETVHEEVARSTIAVLDLRADGAMRNLARGLATAVAQEVGKLGHDTIDERAIRAQIDAEALEDAMSCGLDAGCLSDALRGLEADTVIAGTLYRGSRAYEIGLIYVDLETGREIGKISRSVLIASRRVQRDVREAVPALVSGEAEAAGTLRVVTKVSGAQILLNENLAGRTPPAVEVSVSPGRHHLRVVAPDHLPFERYVEVVGGETTTIEPRLFMEPAKARGFPDDD